MYRLDRRCAADFIALLVSSIREFQRLPGPLALKADMAAIDLPARGLLAILPNGLGFFAGALLGATVANAFYLLLAAMNGTPAMR